MPLSWSTKRQLFYFSIVASVVLAVFVGVYFTYFQKEPSCFDNKKNQGELGVDCGGTCLLLCPSQTSDIIVLWSRPVKVVSGLYDAIAMIENPNFNAGVQKISYSFEFYDRNNVFITERKGSTFINPNERFAIFESGIATGERVPTRALFEFNEEPRWIHTTTEKTKILVKNERLESLEFKPKLRATLTNSSVFDERKIVVTALLSNKDNNVVGVSETEVDIIEKDGTRDITFTWPGVFEKAPEVCLVPLDIMMVFDRSGSMNDDKDNPPQPLTDARDAANTFVNTLNEGDRIGLVSFATNASQPIDQALNTDQELTKNAISRISISPEEEVGFTNLGDAILKATRELQSIRSNDIAKKAMIILTDGLANFPEDPGGEVYAEEKAARAKDDEITVYAIGLGDKVNTEFLRAQITSAPEQYYPAEKSSDLFRVYSEIAQVVCPLKTYLIDIIPRINVVDTD